MNRTKSEQEEHANREILLLQNENTGLSMENVFRNVRFLRPITNR